MQSSQFTPGTTVSFTADSTDEMRIILWYYSGTGTIYYDSVSVSPAPSGSTMYFDTAYAPFGEPYGWDGTTDFSFTGMNQDTAYDLYDFPAREYSNVGRWISPDPAGLAAVDSTNPQSWNRYAYVANNPLMYVDPSGMFLVFTGDDGEDGGDGGGGGGGPDPSGGDPCFFYGLGCRHRNPPAEAADAGPIRQEQFIVRRPLPRLLAPAAARVAVLAASRLPVAS